jgi:hypothetical protein
MDLSKANDARLKAALSRTYMHNGRAMSLQAILQGRGALVTGECDGMIDYSRTKFNRLCGREQEAYMAALKARRHYFVNDIKVPKIVHDWAQSESAMMERA